MELEMSSALLANERPNYKESKNNIIWAVMMVEWSACLPCTLMIRVRISLPTTVFL